MERSTSLFLYTAFLPYLHDFNFILTRRTFERRNMATKNITAFVFRLQTTAFLKNIKCLWTFRNPNDLQYDEPYL